MAYLCNALNSPVFTTRHRGEIHVTFNLKRSRPISELGSVAAQFRKSVIVIAQRQPYLYPLMITEGPPDSQPSSAVE